MLFHVSNGLDLHKYERERSLFRWILHNKCNLQLLKNLRQDKTGIY